MLDPKTRAELDQGAEVIAETYPPILARLYTNLKEREEFTDQEAFELVKTYLFAMAGGKGTAS